MGITTYEIKKDGKPFNGTYYSVDSRKVYEIENGTLMTEDKLYTKVPFIIRPIAYAEKPTAPIVKEEIKEEVVIERVKVKKNLKSKKK